MIHPGIKAAATIVFFSAIALGQSDLTVFLRISPFKTTRADVEKSFKKIETASVISGSYSEWVEYRLRQGYLTVSYSRGRCSELERGLYDLAEGTVIRATLRLEKEVKIGRSGANIDGFSSYLVQDANAWLYSNEAGSIQYEGGKKFVHTVRLRPPPDSKVCGD